MCVALKEIYREIYRESFDYENFNNRKKLQKAVYLLENMGVSVGDYSFSWDKYGPYSLSLDYDAQKLVGIEEKEFSFSEFAKSCFAEIREYISANNDYECTEWMECIASLHYLKNVFRITKSKLVEELQERKPYLSNMNANLKALEIVEGISVGN